MTNNWEEWKRRKSSVLISLIFSFSYFFQKANENINDKNLKYVNNTK